jgi:hypothetical protein
VPLVSQSSLPEEYSFLRMDGTHLLKKDFKTDCLAINAPGNSGGGSLVPFTIIEKEAMSVNMNMSRRLAN